MSSKYNLLNIYGQNLKKHDEGDLYEQEEGSPIANASV
jgi:hypothetical protein